MRVIAIVGGGIAFLTALLLVLALTETRYILDSKQFGVPWLTRGGTAFFAAPWLILIYWELISIPLGYAIGDRIERRTDFVPAAIGAAIGVVAGWLFGMDGADRKGVAGANIRIFLMYLGALVGALIALEIVRRYHRERDRRTR